MTLKMECGMKICLVITGKWKKMDLLVLVVSRNKNIYLQNEKSLLLYSKHLLPAY